MLVSTVGLPTVPRPVERDAVLAPHCAKASVAKPPLFIDESMLAHLNWLLSILLAVPQVGVPLLLK